MQNTVQKSASIRFGSGVLSLDNTNLWLIDDAQFELWFETVEIKADNGRLPIKKRITEVMFRASLYEVDLTNLSNILWVWTFASVAASPVNVTDEALGTWRTVWQPIKLANKNGANTTVTSIDVKEDDVSLVDGTDFDTYVADGTNGELGYTYIVPLTAQTGVMTADYTYTPLASKKITWSDVTSLLTFGELTFTNTDASGKVFRIKLFQAYNAENVQLAFVSDDAVDEVMKVPVTFKAYPDDSNRRCEIYDEQSVL